MKKITAILLFAAMLLSFAACGEAEVTEDPGTDTAVSTETAGEIAEETRPMHKVAKSDFGGADFNSAYFLWQGYPDLFFADEATGDAMNDAVYDRTLKIEEYLNVNLTSTECAGSDAYKYGVELKSIITSGDDVFQQLLLHCISGVSELVTGGFLYSLDDIPQIDMTADWWNKEQMEVLRLGQKTYYGISDYMIPCPYAVFFNKDMIANNGMESPYDLVYEGKWTLDKFIDMAISVTMDTNGDGTYGLEDISGVAVDEGSKYISFMTGAGQFITEKGADGKIQLAMNTEKTISIVEKMYTLSVNPGTIFTSTTETKNFANGNILFYLNPITYAEQTRDIEFDLGIVPYPKYDEEQENYISLDWGGLMAVPATVRNPEMVGAVLELQAWESKNEVIPTYYDVLLEGKLARDEQTVDMFDILFDTIAYEVGGNYFGFESGFTDLFYTLSRLVISQQSSDFSSWYKQNEKSANNLITTFYEKLDTIEAQ